MNRLNIRPGETLHVIQNRRMHNILGQNFIPDNILHLYDKNHKNNLEKPHVKPHLVIQILPLHASTSERFILHQCHVTLRDRPVAQIDKSLPESDGLIISQKPF